MIGKVDNLLHSHCFPDVILHVFGSGHIWRTGIRYQLPLIIERCWWFPAGPGFGLFAGLPISQLDIRALAVVFLRRVVPSVMGEQ